ncbi:MAG: signal peptidase I [Acutalibacteraceae bacterium]|nr:signal peptidase I [Acutalibacteraceae bacterium]
MPLKKNKKRAVADMPTIEQLESELQYENYKNRYGRTLRSTIYTLITVSAVAVLVATLLMPVLRIYGMSMTPAVSEGNIVIALKSSEFNQGDIISFYYNNKILVKRVIAFPGDWVDIDKQGNVYVNEKLLEEPYIVDKALGECDIELPYQVPDGKIFVCGDHRSTSIDSRSTTVGCVSEEQIVGKIVFKVWPLNEISSL